MIKNVLIVSSGYLHPNFFARFRFLQILQGTAGFNFHLESSLESLNARDPEIYKAIVLYFYQPAISSEALSILEDFVKHGGGLLSIHTASASFPKEARYQEILGARFTTESPMLPLTLNTTAITNDEQPIFEPTPNFTIKDRLCLHQQISRNQIHFSTEINGKKEPLVWTRQHEEGRVCCFAGGHKTAVFRNDEIKRIIRQGLRWITNS